MYSIRYLFLLFVLFFAFSNSYAAQDLGKKVDLFKIDEIKVEGVKKVEKEAILEKISSRSGMVLDNYLLKNDIKKIYEMKYFEWVEAHQEDRSGKNILIFKVKEKPIITKIFFEGNSEIGQDDLQGLVKTKEFSIVDINTIKADVGILAKHYEEKGFYLANVDYSLKFLNDENVELTFNISEFEKVRVKKVIFLGNVAFKDEQLKEIMETKEESLFSFMNGTGNFKELNFQNDIERLKYFYKTKGHLQINVGSPQITVSEDKRWVFITIKLIEGPVFTVNNITFQGELLFSEENLREKIELKQNATYSEDNLRKDIQVLTELYQDEGYAFANVLRTLEIVPGENKVDIEFSFEKGKLAHFGRVIIKGNTKTRDKVIRRELTIKEGAKFSGSALRISKENVNRLGFFEPNSVIFNTITPQGKDDVLDVEISVKERNTGQISLGAGYSTASGAFFQASVAQTNFQGLGQNLSATIIEAKNSQTLKLGFTEPYLFDSKWTSGVDVFRINNSESLTSSYKRDGFAIRAGHPLSAYTRLYMTYKYEDTNIKAVNDPTIDTATENGVASSISSEIEWDKRNNRMEPTKGHYVSAVYEYAGLGGNKTWGKSTFDARYYYSVIGDLVLRSRFTTSKLDRMDSKPIPRTEKFTLGGGRDMRGYYSEDIGPKRQVYDNDGILRTFNAGGMFTLLGTLEFEHPLAREAGLKWVAFLDAGNVYESYFGKNGDRLLYFDYGVGFRWFSPIGVLRFEFGRPLGNRNKTNDNSTKFNFDIGQYF